MSDEATLREYASAVRKGEIPGPQAEQWMRETANAMDLDWDTLIGGSRAGSVAGGAKAGVSFGFGDELRGTVSAAGAMLPGGRTPQDAYGEGRDNSRQVMRTQKFMNPVAYTGAEIGTGVAMTAVPVVGWGGRAAQGAKAGTTLARGAGLGAVEGGVSAYGNQEGTNSPLTTDVAIGTGLGAAGGLAGDLLGRMFARNSRAGTAAQRELQRLVEETGLEPDEVVASLARGDGPVTTQNQTLLMEARAAFNNASDKARAEVLPDVKARAAQGRQEVIADARQQTPSYLPSKRPDFAEKVTPDNIDQRYSGALEADNANLAQGGIPQDVMDLLDNAQLMDPDTVKTINLAAQTAFIKGGGKAADWTPVVKVKDGALDWVRPPTAGELHQVNRALRTQVSGLYKNSSPAALGADDVQTALRERLGQQDVMPQWGRITSETAMGKDMEDAYAMAATVGQSPQKADEFLAAFSSMSPEQKAGARAALVEELSRRLNKAGPTANPLRQLMPGDGGLEPHMSVVLREVFPGQQLDQIIARAQGRQDLFNAFTAPSQTAELATRGQKYQGGGGGDYVTSIGIDAATGSGGATAVRAGGDLIRQVVKMMGHGEKVADNVLRALTTENPEVLRAAMQGNPEAMGIIQKLAADMATVGLGSQAAQQLPMLSE